MMHVSPATAGNVEIPQYAAGFLFAWQLHKDCNKYFVLSASF